MKNASDEMTDDDRRAHLHGMLRSARIVMLLSKNATSAIQGRPMSLARVDSDDTLYFASSFDSAKVAEITACPDVSVCVHEQGYAMLEGRARVSQDRALIDELWQDDWAAWFSGGKADPSIAIIIVDPARATYWAGGLGNGLSYLFRMLKARVTGEPISRSPDDVAHVDLR